MPVVSSQSSSLGSFSLHNNSMRPWRTTKDEKELGPRGPCSVAQREKRAVAVGHSILVIIYHVLRDQKPYHELGGNYLDERDPQALEKRLVRRLEKLGYQVSFTN